LGHGCSLHDASGTLAQCLGQSPALALPVGKLHKTGPQHFLVPTPRQQRSTGQGQGQWKMWPGFLKSSRQTPSVRRKCG
jgi:hypothetical protein